MTVSKSTSSICPPLPTPTTHYGRLPGNSIRCPQGGWARTRIEKANLFTNYLSNVLKPHSSNAVPEITEYLHSPFQMSPPIKPFTSLEVTELIHRLNPRKAPGHDQISNKAIKELPVEGIALIFSIFNSIFRLKYYPKTCKTSQITSPGKPIHETSSYRPISLPPTLSKLFEKLLTNRLFPLLKDLKTLPDHQFGFRKQHSTVEQIHRITHMISQTLERKNTAQRYSLICNRHSAKYGMKGSFTNLKKSYHTLTTPS